MMRRFSAILIAAGCVWGCQSSETSDNKPAPSPAATKTTKVVPEKTGTRTSTVPKTVQRSYKAMGTHITLTALTLDESLALQAFKDAFLEFDRLEALLTIWRPTSDVAKINAAAGKAPVKVAKETMEVLKAARSWSQKTEGKFDVTFGALSGLWKFDHDKDDRIPDKKRLKKQLALVGYERLILDEKAGTAFLADAGMKVHLGGIGKGYGVDKAVAIMKAKGLDSFMVQAGGDLFVVGRKRNRPWRVGIRDPRGPPSSYFAASEVIDATFSTSGDYERFFIQDGKRYHHIIDPDLGQPASLCRSVTVFAPSAMVGDVLSTSVFLLGVEKGMKLVEATEGAGAVVVDAKNEVHVSRRLDGKIKFLKKPTDGI